MATAPLTLLDITKIREIIPDDAFGNLLWEGYLPRGEVGSPGLAIPPQVTEYPARPTTEWLERWIATWEGADVPRQVRMKRARLGAGEGRTAAEKDCDYLYHYWATSTVPKILEALGIRTRTSSWQRFDIYGLDSTQLGLGPGTARELKPFFLGKSSVTPDPNADLASLINRGVPEAEWTALAQMVLTIDRWNEDAALYAPSHNWRPVRQLGAVLRRYWPTLQRWECVFQPAGGLSLRLQENWPIEDQIKYMQKFEEVKALGDMFGRQWTAPIPWPIPAHATEQDALAHAVADATGQPVPYETTWEAFISQWHLLTEGAAAAAAKVAPAATFTQATGRDLAGAAAPAQDLVDIPAESRYTLWPVAVLLLAVLLLGAAQ